MLHSFPAMITDDRTLDKPARRSSPVQFDTLLHTRFSEVVGLLDEVGFQAKLKLSFGDGGYVQMIRKTILDYRGCNDFIFIHRIFHGRHRTHQCGSFMCQVQLCFRHGKVTTFHRPKSSRTTKCHRRYVDMPRIY